MDIIDAMAPEYGESRNAASIKIIGVGGGGGNAANRMYAEGIPDVDFIICNSDEQDLRKSPIPTKIRLGQGLGCGSNAEKGEEYAKEVTAEIEELLEGTQMVFITAGMGGGTGTGAAPVIAEISKGKGILTVAIVTIPYKFEGTTRYKNALHGVEALSQHVDSILIINNQTLREQYGALPMRQSFAKADGILSVATKSIAEIMQKTGFVNVDFEDVRAVMHDSGVAVMARGSASGEERAYKAIEATLDSPLLNKADIRGAKKILLNITSSAENELTGDELEVIMDFIREKAETDVDITWGYLMDEPEDGEEVQITMIATGFEIDDIPDLRQAAPVKTVRLHGDEEVVPPVAPSTSNPQKFNEPLNVSVQNFNYAEVKKMEDISQFEDQPAFKRQIKSPLSTMQSQARPVVTTTTTTATIQGTAPSQFSISPDTKGIKLSDDNKYLNHNVD